MSKFPIAEAIRSGILPVLPDWWKRDDEVAGAIDWKYVMTESAFFDFDLPSDLFWHGQKNSYSLESDLGPIRPPFRDMWIEWQIPRDPVGINSDAVETAAGIRMGAWVSCEDSSELSFDKATVLDREGNPLMRHEGPVVMAWQLIMREQDGIPRLSPISTVMGIDAQTGRYVPGTRNVGGHNATISTMIRENPREVLSIADAPQDVIWLGMNLLNCRNVTTRNAGVAHGRSGREKRQGVPVKRYHTIVLPGMSSQPGKGGRLSRSDEAVMAMHRVRGHFKTYTPEAPLLGKHSGTFWWGWQVRGSKARGEVVSDYAFKG